MHNIKLLREKKGMTQRELARLLHITQQSVYKYETGQATPSIHLLREISNFFNTTIEYLLDENSTYTSSKSDYLDLSIDEYKLIQNYRQLPTQTQKMLKTVSDKLVTEENKALLSEG